jgi:hypothetical protein
LFFFLDLKLTGMLTRDYLYSTDGDPSKVAGQQSTNVQVTPSLAVVSASPSGGSRLDDLL